MSTMVERVARAIEDADIGYSIRLTRLVDGIATYTLTDSDREGELEFPSHGEALEYITRKKIERKARAAIEAMMEPTSKMLDAAADEEDRRGYFSHENLIAEDVWPIMIQAALKESE